MKIKNLSILLVEDNLLNQRVTMYNLKKYDHNVTIANNGVEAIDLYQESNYDLVLMDIMMPKMDGLEATQEIRRIEKEQNMKRTPVIAVTANTLDNDRDKCLSIGMDDYMCKPFEMNQLNVILESINF